jgi:hypothetical protein
MNINSAGDTSANLTLDDIKAYLRQVDARIHAKDERSALLFAQSYTTSSSTSAINSDFIQNKQPKSSLPSDLYSSVQKSVGGFQQVRKQLSGHFQI